MHSLAVLSVAELKDFLKYVSGSPHVHGNSVTVDFIPINLGGRWLTVDVLHISYTNGY